MIKDAPIAMDENSDLRYREVIKRLKKLLDVERQSIMDLRERHAAELAEKTELEQFLRQCIEDTRREIALRRNAGVPGATTNSEHGLAAAAAGIPLNEFDEKDREHVMELLLSQERVIGLLYAKTFPTRTKPPVTSLPPVSNQERDFTGPSTAKPGKLPDVLAQ